MSKIEQIKIPLCLEIKGYYTLTRTKDNQKANWYNITSLHYNENGLCIKKIPQSIIIGNGLWFENSTNYWHTTIVREIEQISENEIHFWTDNSHYILDTTNSRPLNIEE